MNIQDLVETFFQSQNINDQYQALNAEGQLSVCMLICEKLSKQLDSNQLEMINDVGTFLSLVSKENARLSIKEKINISRLIKFNLDQNEIWSRIFDSLSEPSENLEILTDGL